MMDILKILLFSGRENFRVTVFLPMIDHLLIPIQKMLKSYDAVSGKFVFLSKMTLVNGDQLNQVRDAEEWLVKTYPEYPNTSFHENNCSFPRVQDTFPGILSLLITNCS